MLFFTLRASTLSFRVVVDESQDGKEIINREEAERNPIRRRRTSIPIRWEIKVTDGSEAKVDTRTDTLIKSLMTLVLQPWSRVISQCL